MKNKITTLLISSIMISGILHAKPISEEEATNVALNYAFQKLSKKSKTIMIKDFTINSSGDTRMWLYNKYGNQIAYNDDGGTNYLSKITQTLDSGTYYIKIDEYGNNNIISSYDIRIQ